MYVNIDFLVFIVDKFYALKVLTPENAGQIKALAPYNYQSLEQTVSYKNDFARTFGFGQKDIKTVERKMSIDRQIWDNFTPNQSAPEHVPYLGTNTAVYGGKDTGMFHVQFFSEAGTIPNNPSAYNPVDIVTGEINYNRFVFYEEIVPANEVTTSAMARAQEVLKTFGTSPMSEITTPVVQTAEMKAAQKATEMKRVAKLVEQVVQN